MRKKLRLYLWRGVLTDYTDGVAFALAYSVDEAVEEVKKAGVSYDWKWDGAKLDGVEPEVIESPFGFYLYGGG